MNNKLIKNPKDNGKGGFDCEIFHPQHGYIPFTANANDSEQHGRDIYALIESGEAGEIAPPPAPSSEQEVFEQEREFRLSEAHNYANQPLKYGALSEQQKTELQSYFNSLNALELGDAWPTKPAFLN